MFIFSQHKERIIFISDELNEETSNELVATLLYLDGLKSSKDLSFFINCRGGDVNFLYFCIYKQMEKLAFLVVPFFPSLCVCGWGNMFMLMFNLLCLGPISLIYGIVKLLVVLLSTLEHDK